MVVANMLSTLLLIVALASWQPASAQSSNCPGYTASSVSTTDSGLTARLELAGSPCNSYGIDVDALTLLVEYQTDKRLHVKIADANETIYQVPEDVVPRPNGPSSSSADSSQLRFDYTESPFSFTVSRKDGEVIFDTSSYPLIFQNQYLGLRTSLPADPYLYGFGEHSDPHRLNTTDYTRTLWNRDSFGIPPGTNLYGDHPVYYESRGEKGTHGVFLLNSNALEIKINQTETDGQYLEYNALGGVFDFYFFDGPSPVEASQQYAQIVGLPAMMPYWAFGFHQCRYGYRDVFQVAEVVYNYSEAGIPLETMWTDIDYMFDRWIFTLDPLNFPLELVRALVSYLHAHQQQYIVMVDPAIAIADNYSTYSKVIEQDLVVRYENGTIFRGVVWPGPTVFPDWFNPGIQDFWSNEFTSFFSASEGVDIDGLWIDMNEAANFCNYPCADAAAFAEEGKFPPEGLPARSSNPRPLPGFPSGFQPGDSTRRVKRQMQSQAMMGLPGRDLIDPPYSIDNAAGSLSNKTIDTDVVHSNGLAEYDVHNLYGLMMSTASRTAMLARRPDRRPLVITRSTFAGAGATVGKWLGDNLSQWDMYRLSIGQMLDFSSLFQMPMVGSDVCGFGGNTTETLCARWAMLGAFYPFFRNHNVDNGISQEFYRWESVTQSAIKAIDIRYRMLDYFYTAFHKQTIDGTPSLYPMWFVYPDDTQARNTDLQFFWGPAVLVSPVTEENITSVDIYLPRDVFYDFNDDFAVVRGTGTVVTLEDIDYQTIPIHIRGGTIVPLRTESANTTTELRKKDFDIVVAAGTDGSARGSLYLDDGDSIEQTGSSEINFGFADGIFSMKGTYGYDARVKIKSIIFLGQLIEPETVTIPGQGVPTYNFEAGKVTIDANLPLTDNAEIVLVPRSF